MKEKTLILESEGFSETYIETGPGCLSISIINSEVTAQKQAVHQQPS